MHRSLLTLALATCFAVGLLPAQGPASRGAPAGRSDPTLTLDLGHERMTRGPTRADPKAPYEHRAAACSLCVETGQQRVVEPVREPTPIGRDLTVFGPWLAHLAGKKPIFITTRRALIVCALEPRKVDDLTAHEIDNLRTIFPALPKTPSQLDEHQLAHLWAERLLWLDAELSDILELGADGRVQPMTSDYQPLAHDRIEVDLFGSKKVYTAFASYAFPTESWPLGGQVLQSGPTVALDFEEGRSAAQNRRFRFAVTLQMLHALARPGDGIPAWMKIGIAHWFESRLAVKAEIAIEAATWPPHLKFPDDWNTFVSDLVSREKSGALGALTASPITALSERSRLQSWSLIRFFVATNRAKFAALVRKLLHTPPTVQPQKALLDALRDTMNLDFPAVETAWKAWVATGN